MNVVCSRLRHFEQQLAKYEIKLEDWANNAAWQPMFNYQQSLMRDLGLATGTGEGGGHTMPPPTRTAPHASGKGKAKAAGGSSRKRKRPAAASYSSSSSSSSSSVPEAPDMATSLHTVAEGPFAPSAMDTTELAPGSEISLAGMPVAPSDVLMASSQEDVALLDGADIQGVQPDVPFVDRGTRSMEMQGQGQGQSESRSRSSSSEYSEESAQSLGGAMGDAGMQASALMDVANVLNAANVGDVGTLAVSPVAISRHGRPIVPSHRFLD